MSKPADATALAGHVDTSGVSARSKRPGSTKSLRSRQVVISDLEWGEIEAEPWPEGSSQSLRLLARWLVAAARKGAPVAVSGGGAEGQNALDVAPDAEVVSDTETDRMPVQQAFQKGPRR